MSATSGADRSFRPVMRTSGSKPRNSVSIRYCSPIRLTPSSASGTEPLRVRAMAAIRAADAPSSRRIVIGPRTISGRLTVLGGGSETGFAKPGSGRDRRKVKGIIVHNAVFKTNKATILNHYFSCLLN